MVILLALAAIIASRWGGASAEYTTCKMEDHEYDYDIKATIMGPDGGELPIVKYTSDIRVSGEDLHIISTREGSPGFREHIFKNGKYYTKPPGGVWEEPPAEIYNNYYIYKLINNRPIWMPRESQYILCDRDGPNRARIGHYTRKMVIGPEYIVGPNNEMGLSPEELANVPDTNATWEYRTGSDGKIKWTKQTFAVAGGEDWHARETTATISGVGEPNEITAPVMGTS